MTDPTADPRHDELLAIRCKLGEAAAFDALIERWHRPLWMYVRRMTGDDDEAAEMLQDIWLRVLRAMPRLRDPARLRAWLFGIARRALMDRLRLQYAASFETAIDDSAATDDSAALDDNAATDDTGGLPAAIQADVQPEAIPADGFAAEDIQAMREELALMPFTEREVLALFYLQELTLAQVADVLDVPVGTVKSRLFRARRMLRQRLITRKGFDHE